MTTRTQIKNTRYIWLPALLIVYLAAMAYVGRDMLLVEHNYLRYFGTIGAEVACIVALSFFLRKKYLLKERREALSGENDVKK
mgnify:CR=1 FL=1